MFLYRYAYGGAGPWSSHPHRCTHAHGWRSGRQFATHSGPMLGVRRPIRYLAYKLDLDDDQVRALAEILDRLKTARAQADVDWQRTASELAGALEGADFDATRTASAMEARARSAEQLRTETSSCLQQLHRLLDPEQRRELAYLIRSGGLTF